MKKFLLLVTPPFIIVLFKKISILIGQTRIRTNPSGIDNYNDDSLTKMIVDKNAIFSKGINRTKTIDLGAIRTILGVCISGIDHSNNLIKVLDLGGGGGYHYFISRLVLNEKLKIIWHVVETESMVRSARILSNNELKFFSSIPEASSGIEKFDIVVASSSLQYFSNQTEIIDEIIKIRSKTIFVTRTPFSLSEPIVGEKQYSLFSANGPGPLPNGYKDKVIEFPIYIMNLNEFTKRFTDHYDIKLKIKEEVAGFRIKGKVFDNYGFYFTSKE